MDYDILIYGIILLFFNTFVGANGMILLQEGRGPGVEGLGKKERLSSCSFSLLGHGAYNAYSGQKTTFYELALLVCKTFFLQLNSYIYAVVQ